MNALSWTLYIAEVSDSIKGFTGVFSWLLALVMFFSLVGAAVCFGAGSDYRDGDPNRVGAWKWRDRLFGWALKVFLPLFIIVFLLSSFIPSRNTLMMIAASQFGEVALNSDAAQKMGGEAGDLAVDSLKLLHQYVADQLAPKPDAK